MSRTSAAAGFSEVAIGKRDMDAIEFDKANVELDAVDKWIAEIMALMSSTVE